ncbi:unnamed protein product [Somion occarium]|uniref:Beta-lactamase-related domain-containing protein n=1 Tax=Somion occarium TaxID=3059160 RepID=A0ABP1CQ73_9APHY
MSFVLFALILFSGIVTASPSQVSLTDDAIRPPKRAITPELSAYAQKVMDEYQTPGLSIGVVHFDKGTGKVETEYGFWGNKTEDGAKATNETLFVIGSISKAFTASAVGILMDDFAQGRNVTPLPLNVLRFTWDTKIRDLLPEYWNFTDRWITEKANVKDILSHVSGFPRSVQLFLEYTTLMRLKSRLKFLPPAFELRERWMYNNQMFVLGGLIVETYSKQSLTSFVTSRIFKPLGMNDTSYDAAVEEESGCLSQSFARGNGTARRIPLWMGPSSEALLAAAGGIVSNTIDMNKWLAMLLNNGVDPTSNVTILPTSVYDTVTTAHALVLGRALMPSLSMLGYGLGWMRYSAQGHEVIVHGGGLPGFLSEIGYFPDDGLGVVSFINQNALEVNTLVLNRIVTDVLGLREGANIVAPTPPTFRSSATTEQGNSPNFGQTPRPVGDHCGEQTPPLPLEAYAGTYSHPGYGSFTLCAPSTKTSTCKELFSNYTTVFPSQPAEYLHAAWPRVWFSHLRVKFHYSSQNRHAVYLDPLTLFPNGYGKDTSPFAFPSVLDIQYPAAFVEDGDGRIKGLALPNGFNDIEPISPILDDRLEESSFLYFEKLFE